MVTIPGTLKRLKVKAVGKRAVERYGKKARYRTVSLRPDGAFVVTSGKWRGRRCSVRDIEKDMARKAKTRGVPSAHRHQGDMKGVRKKRYI